MRLTCKVGKPKIEAKKNEEKRKEKQQNKTKNQNKTKRCNIIHSRSSVCWLFGVPCQTGLHRLESSPSTSRFAFLLEMIGEMTAWRGELVNKEIEARLALIPIEFVMKFAERITDDIQS